MNINLHALLIKQRIIVYTLSLFILISFCACANDTTSLMEAESSSVFADPPITLRVITEETISNGMNSQLNILAEKFQADHPNVTIKAEILPNRKEDRDVYLAELRSQTAAGQGPDIYLLPTSDVITTDHSGKNAYISISPLFPNIPVAMRKGSFADISQFYDSDDSIPKESLATEIMDAGVIGDARYVLPLRYNIQAAYVYPEDLKAAGADLNLLNGSFVEWMQHTAALGNPQIACGADYVSINVFSDLIDYDSGRVTLSVEEVAQYIQAIASVNALAGSEVGHRNQLTLLDYGYGFNKQYPVHIDNLQNAMNHVAIAASEEKELSIYPIRTTDGDIVATVTYYGAVSSACDNPEMAYQFLQLFLTKESQWELNRPAANKGEYRSLIERGWPVLVSGSVEPLWTSSRNQAMTLKGASGEFYNLKNITLSDTSISLFQEDIDIVRFPFPLEAISMLSSLNNYNGGNIPAYEECELVAREFIDRLSQQF